MDLPIFDSIPQSAERVLPAAPLAVPVPLYAAGGAGAGAAHTEELLREFETVYGVVELTHLTPPQSPPGPASQLLASYAQQAAGGALEPWPPAPQPQYACFDAVDELVRQHGAQLPSPGSLSTSPPSSPRSSGTDEEWSGPARPKPYARQPEERRSRKKEQNKNAATRYRQKKKAEIEVLLGEEATLRQRHGELGDTCSDLQREIRYLKGLMRDLFKAKGLIK